MKNRLITYVIFATPLIITLYFWLTTTGLDLTSSASILISLGRLMGLITAYFVLIQFVLRGRIMPLEKIFGYELLNKIHKKIGLYLTAFLISHPMLLTLGYSMQGKINPISQYIQFITIYENVWLAFIGYITFLLIIFSSIYIVRNKLRYEFWYIVHLAVYIAVLLSFFHQFSVGTDFLLNKWFSYYWYLMYFIVFAITIYTRFIVLILRFKKHRFYIDKVIKETDDTISLFIKGVDLKNFHFEPGQFLFVRFLSKELSMESHPFSFSSIPNAEYLRITIKKEGDFTEKLMRIKSGTKLLIDGPHGAFTERFMKKDKILFIAAGVGITPIRSIIESIGNSKQQILFYSNRTSSDIIFKKELDSLSQKYKFPIYYVISREGTYKGIKGRIDLNLIKQYVSNLMEFDIYICGPKAMAKNITHELKSSGVHPSQIHFEEFVL